MYKRDDIRVKVDIQLENGIYVFLPYSATGKTYLKKQLEYCRGLGDNVVAYTYSDLARGLSLRASIDALGANPDVIMLDRYDLYSTKFWDIINKYAKESIILLECKNDSVIDDLDYDYADIELAKDKITVTC